MRRNEYISVTVVITRTHSMGNGSMGPRLVLLLSLPISSYLKDCSVDIDICKLFQINLIVLLQYMIFDRGSKGSLAPIVHNQRWKIKISLIWKRQVCIVNLLGEENLAQPIYIGRGGYIWGCSWQSMQRFGIPIGFKREHFKCMKVPDGFFVWILLKKNKKNGIENQITLWSLSSPLVCMTN